MRVYYWRAMQNHGISHCLILFVFFVFVFNFLTITSLYLLPVAKSNDLLIIKLRSNLIQFIRIMCLCFHCFHTIINHHCSSCTDEQVFSNATLIVLMASSHQMPCSLEKISLFEFEPIIALHTFFFDEFIINACHKLCNC